MRNRFLLILLIGLFVLLWFTPRAPTANTASTGNTAITAQGDGSDPASPLAITLDTYYGATWTEYFSSHKIRYLAFPVQANELYFIYFNSPMWWDLELYLDPGFTILLGSPYKVTEGGIFKEYLFFSPNHTGFYYLKLYKTSSFTSVQLAVLTADPYAVNTSELVIISPDSHPIQVFQVTVDAGEYSASDEVLYARVVRGWNYVALPAAYGQFPPELFTLGAGTLGIIIEESCQFQLTYYLHNETPPVDPPDENDTRDDPLSIFGNITPAFGIGILVGVLVLYKVKKK